MSDGYTKQPRVKNVFTFFTSGNQVQGMKPHSYQHAIPFFSFVADMLCNLWGAFHRIPQVSHWCIWTNTKKNSFFRRLQFDNNEH